MFSNILFNPKTKGLEWSVIVLAIATHLFSAEARAEDPVSAICPIFGKNNRVSEESDFVPGYLHGYSTTSIFLHDNSTGTRLCPENSTSGFLNLLILTGIIGFIIILSYLLSSLNETNTVVHILKEKIVDLTCSLSKTTTNYQNLLDDYETTKAALDEAQIRIKSLEQELLVKTQAISEAEGLLNESMMMATQEVEKIKRQGANVNAKYTKAKRDLKASRSEVDKLDSTNVKLERLVVKLEDEVKEYRVFLPFDRRGALDDISENPRINYDRLLQLGTLWKSGPCTRLTPDLGLEETKSLENLESEASQVPSVHEEPECLMDVQQDAPIPKKKRMNFFKRNWRKVFPSKPKSTSEPKTVKDTKSTLRSDLTERVGPKPP